MKEMIGTILLATVCFLIACLNLWNIFKDWFDGKYQRKNDTSRTDQIHQKQETVPNIIGKSKPVFRELPQTPKLDEEKQRLEKEILELKRQLEEREMNEPFLSIPLEKKNPFENNEINPEEENVPIITEKERSPFSTGTSLDEFELVVKTLQGKQITKEEKIQVTNIIPKIEGTEIYNQFTKQIHGAEKLANEITGRLENESNLSDGGYSNLSGFIRT